MKSLFFTVASLVLMLAFTACKNDKAADTTDTTAQPGLTAPAAPAASSGVEHYICPNGHVGYGGATAGNCTQCGAELAHNQAFHANDNAAAPNIQMTPPAGDASAPAVQAPPAAASAAQNAAGVWHYTCANGCAGGAGEAVACSKCGSALQHNQAYHN